MLRTGSSDEQGQREGSAQWKERGDKGVCGVRCEGAFGTALWWEGVFSDEGGVRHASPSEIDDKARGGPKKDSGAIEKGERGCNDPPHALTTGFFRLPSWSYKSRFLPIPPPSAIISSTWTPVRLTRCAVGVSRPAAAVSADRGERYSDDVGVASGRVDVAVALDVVCGFADEDVVGW